MGALTTSNPQHLATPADPNASAFTSATPPRTGVAVKLLGFYIFLVISRILDVSPIAFLHIPLTLLCVLIVIALFRRDLRSVFTLRISRWYFAFTIWVAGCYPFSTWRAQSLISIEAALHAFAVYFIIAQLVKTELEWRTIAGAYAYGVLAASVLSFFLGRIVEGRIALLNGSDADPNDFALILAVGLPFWWLKASRANALGKVIYFACTAPIFVAFARTGSRSGLIALGTLFLVVILFGKASQKLLIAVLAIAGVIVGAAFLPEYLKVRFTTFFTDTSAEQLDLRTQERLGSDIASAEGREMLLIQSLQMTAEHPLFGVGPGIFASASWDERKKKTGKGGLLLVSHNTYTQISSETGIPGFILFAGTLFLCIKYTISGYRAARSIQPDLAKDEFYMFASLAALAVGIFFLSKGYTDVLAIMFVLAACLDNISKNVLAGEPVPAEAPISIAPVNAPKSAPKPKEPVRAGRPGRFRSLRHS